MRSASSATAASSTSTRPPWRRVKPTCGQASAVRVTSSLTCPTSVAGAFRNLRRAGTLPNRSATSTRVPTGVPTSRASTLARRAPSPPACRRGRRRAASISVVRDTAAMLASASPRKPSVAIAPRSSTDCSLLVAWRAKAVTASSALMPSPSSTTAISAVPACSRSTAMRRAAGVERVLDQLLDHRRRPLDHLAGGDLVGDLGAAARGRAARRSPPAPRSHERSGRLRRQPCLDLRRDPPTPCARPARRSAAAPPPPPADPSCSPGAGRPRTPSPPRTGTRAGRG